MLLVGSKDKFAVREATVTNSNRETTPLRTIIPLRQPGTSQSFTPRTNNTETQNGTLRRSQSLA